MKVRYLLFESYHGKRGVGSSRIRGHSLIKNWPEADIYKYGENPDVMIFQKVYMQFDWKFIKNFKGIKILDICDPDWMGNEMQNLKETIDVVDGVTVPTEPLKEFLSQMTDKPIRVVPDRHEVELAPNLRLHSGRIKKAVWYGYKQNAELLRFAVPSLEAAGIHLTVLSNDDPSAYRWAKDGDSYQSLYEFKKYSEDTILTDLANADICLLPEGNRPQDRFKSNNKTTLAWLAGVPVVVDGDELKAMQDPEARNKEAKQKQAMALKQYDVKLSVTDMQSFIEDIRRTKT